MKVLHVTQGYYPALGGTEILIQRVSEELHARFKDEVTVFTTNCYSGEAFFTSGLPTMPVGWEEVNGIQVRRFPVRSKISRWIRPLQSLAYRWHLPGEQYLRAMASGPLIPGLEKSIRQQPADVIAASSFPLLHMFTALRAAHATGRPCVLHGGLHPEDRWGFDRPMIDQAIRQADHYIANTGYEADYLIRRGIDANHISVIGVGVDPESFQAANVNQAKTQLGLLGKPVIGFIGQVGRHKGVDTILQAMPQVWEMFPDAHLLIAGAKTLFADPLQAMIDALDPQQRSQVTLLYNFPPEQKPVLFAAVDVLVYPSGYESFGIAYLEAWACRKPVIGCQRGAVPWVIHAGRDGLLVPYQDDKALANAMILLLANPAWAVCLGEAGWQKVQAYYTWSAIAENFHKVYETALARYES